ncbi:hypothetical protein V6Z11_D08G089600 [Gossypium hirsutum]
MRNITWQNMIRSVNRSDYPSSLSPAKTLLLPKNNIVPRSLQKIKPLLSLSIAPLANSGTSSRKLHCSPVFKPSTNSKCATPFTVQGQYLKIQIVHFLQPPCPLNLASIPSGYFECMQALRPQRQKAASKLIFTNGDFDDCQLFDSIDLTYQENKLAELNRGKDKVVN